MSSIPENIKTLKIEYDSEDLKKVEDAVGEIRSLAMQAWMGTEKESRHCLKEIVLQTNSITNLMLNGVIMEAVELSR